MERTELPGIIKEALFKINCPVDKEDISIVFSALALKVCQNVPIT
jgi:hypothetical protein